MRVFGKQMKPLGRVFECPSFHFGKAAAAESKKDQAIYIKISYSTDRAGSPVQIKHHTARVVYYLLPMCLTPLHTVPALSYKLWEAIVKSIHTMNN